MCDNYRTISLLNTLTKWLTKMLNNRLSAYVEVLSPFELEFDGNGNILPATQMAFRQSRSREDLILTMESIANEHWKKNITTFFLFIDLKKAYDYVSREVMWKLLSILGVPDKFVTLLTNMHVGSFAKLRLFGALSREISLASGLKQGCGIAPLLFNIFFAALFAIVQIKYSRKEISFQTIGVDGNTVKQFRLRDLMFADDVAALFTTEKGVQDYLDVLYEVATMFGMVISDNKTEIMIQYGNPKEIDYQTSTDPEFFLGPIGLENLHLRKKLKLVDSFKYLGVWFTSRRPFLSLNDVEVAAIDVMAKDIQKRTQTAWWSFMSWAPLLRAKFRNLSERITLFKVYVVPCLLQAIGVRVLATRHIEELESCYYRMIRSMLGWNPRRMASHWDMYEACGIISFEALYFQEVIRWGS